MENYIENKPNWFKKIGSKFLAVLSVMMIGFVIMLCLGCQVSANAAEISTTDKTKTELYDTKWTKANIEFFCFREHWVWSFGDRTTHLLRITDKNDNFINDITYLSASFEIGKSGKVYPFKVDKELSSVNDGFTFGNVFSMEGQLSSITDEQNEMYHDRDKYAFTGEDGGYVAYQDCNYKWEWNFYVIKIVYLYVWYIDPTTGEQVASSFMPNGEHPLYNEDGTLKGIFDVDNNKVENMTLNKYGIPSTITENADGTTIVTPIIGWDEQQKGSVIIEDTISNWWDNLLPGTGEDGNKGVLYYIALIIRLTIYLLIISAIIYVIKFIIRIFKKD